MFSKNKKNYFTDLRWIFAAFW